MQLLFNLFLMAISEPVTTVPSELFEGPTKEVISDHSSYKIEMTEPLSGPDFKLILQAYKHREMKGSDLSCYHIRVFRERGVTRVAFIGNRPPERYIDQGDMTAIVLPGPNPRCPTRSFEMDERGKVKRVIYERH